MLKFSSLVILTALAWASAPAEAMAQSQKTGQTQKTDQAKRIGLPLLLVAIKKGDFIQAGQIAFLIDQKLQKGAVFVPFVQANQAMRSGDCSRAIGLAKTTAKRTPKWLPPQEIIVYCYVQQNKRSKAIKQLEGFVAGLPTQNKGSKAAAAILVALKEKTKAIIGVDISAMSSSNLARRTDNTFVGNGFSATTESLARKGSAISANVHAIKPIISEKDYSIASALKIGAKYNSLSKTIYPKLGFSLNGNYNLSKRTHFFASSFFENNWAKTSSYYYDAGLKLGASHSLSQHQKLSALLGYTNRNYRKDDAKDAHIGSFTASHKTIVNEQNAFTISATAQIDWADNDYYSNKSAIISADWQHFTKTGLGVSLGGKIGFRDHERTIPFSLEKREDKFVSASIGVTHKALEFKGFVPEIAYTYTHQNSNDFYHDFDAHDVGIRFRANF